MTQASRMLAIFAGSRVAYGSTKIKRVGRNGKTEADSWIVRDPITEEAMQEHLDGSLGVGSIPIDEDNACRFGCIDVDVYDLDHKQLQQKITKLKFPLSHCRSKSGGAHLYLFLEQREPAAVVREFLTEMSIALGFSGSEIFPKQDTILSEQGDVGNFINLPYFKAEETVRYCFDSKVEALELDDFLDHAEKSVTTIDTLEALRLGGKEDFFDGPPCLQHMCSQGAISSDRNTTLFNCGVYCRKKWADDWPQKLEQMNRELTDQPLPASEMAALQKSVGKKDYFYTCKQEPIKSYCDPDVCRTRKYGVGDDMPDAPKLGGLVTMLSEPRLHFLDVTGRRVQLSTEQLQNQTLFQRACMDQLSIMPPTMRPAKWQMLISALMVNSTRIEVPEELTYSGQFKDHLRMYCTSRIRAVQAEEVTHGKPWTEDGFTSFMIAGLMEYLRNRNFTHYTRAEVTEALKKLNGGKDAEYKLNYRKADGKRTTARVWRVPAFEETDVELDVKEIPNDIPF